jgi:hypothetical protein
VHHGPAYVTRRREHPRRAVDHSRGVVEQVQERGLEVHTSSADPTLAPLVGV